MMLRAVIPTSLFLLAPVGAMAQAETPRGVGMDPTDLVANALGQPAAAATEERYTDHFEPYFHGFIKAPLNLGFAPNGTVNSPPRVPDSDYLDWRFTNNPGGPWSELHMAFAQDHVSANVSIAAYSVTDAGYNHLSAQLGINNAFISFNYPELFGDRGGLVAHVGSFSNRYGAAGRYGAGIYETYLMGATHVEGENIRLFFHAGDRLTVHVEQGFGAKLEVPPSLPTLDAPYLPYGGPVQQGTTLLHHEHLGLTVDDTTTLALHYLTDWTDDASQGEVDGRITSMGADLRVADSRFGDAYVGFSRINSRDNWRVAGALEALHSADGWNFNDNYFGAIGSGTGTIESLLVQYDFSTARYNWHPQEFWGQDRDLVISPFLMVNHISSTDPKARGPSNKAKGGLAMTFTPLRWFGAGARYDTVHPDLSDSTQSFQVISPKVILRSDYASHEYVAIQYNAYINGEAVTPVYPHEARQADRHTFSVTGVVWW